MTPTAPAKRMPWWQILLHVLAVAAPAAAAFVSINSRNANTQNLATQDAALASQLAQGLSSGL